MVQGALESSQSSVYDDDLMLVDRFIAGDRTAFTPLYQRHYDKVLSIARGVILRPDEAADATQEIFTQVYRNLHRFDQRARFSTWLYRIAVNRAIQYSRKLKPLAKLDPLENADFHRHDLPDTSLNHAAVDAAMQQLRPKDRALLTLYYWEQLSLRDLADSIGTSENSAKTALYRARERFKKLYQEAP